MGGVYKCIHWNELGNFFLEPVRFVLYMSLLRSRFDLLIFFHPSANSTEKWGSVNLHSFYSGYEIFSSVYY